MRREFRVTGRIASTATHCGAVLLLPLVLFTVRHALGGAAVAQAQQRQVQVVQERRFQINEQTLASWVFNDSRAPNDQGWLERSLETRIDFLETIGTLRDEQRRKLELAGRGDIHRFWTRYELLRRECPTGMITQDEYMQFRQKALPLQLRYRDGLFGATSLFRKTIRSVLDADQLAEFETLERERDRKHYQALVKATVATLDQKLALTEDQRTRLTKLVLEKTEPPTTYGQGAYQLYIVLWQMSQIPESDLKPLFLDDEWRVVQALFQQARVTAGDQRRVKRDADLDE